LLVLSIAVFNLNGNESESAAPVQLFYAQDPFYQKIIVSVYENRQGLNAQATNNGK